MKNSTDKIIIFILIGLFVVYIGNSYKEKKEDKMYKILPQKYTVCNKSIYVTNFTYNNELDVQQLLNEIECLCKNNC